MKIHRRVTAVSALGLLALSLTACSAPMQNASAHGPCGGFPAPQTHRPVVVIALDATSSDLTVTKRAGKEALETIAPWAFANHADVLIARFDGEGAQVISSFLAQGTGPNSLYARASATCILKAARSSIGLLSPAVGGGRGDVINSIDSLKATADQLSPSNLRLAMFGPDIPSSEARLARGKTQLYVIQTMPSSSDSTQTEGWWWQMARAAGGSLRSFGPNLVTFPAPPMDRPSTVASVTTSSWSAPSDVLFPFDSDRLLPQAGPAIRQVASLLRLRSTHITVTGYTDDVGSESYNLDLSRRRAASVARALKAEGILPSRLTVIGGGESNFVASNDTPEGRSMNRRVVVKFDG